MNSVKTEKTYFMLVPEKENLDQEWKNPIIIYGNEYCADLYTKMLGIKDTLHNCAPAKYHFKPITMKEFNDFQNKAKMANPSYQPIMGNRNLFNECEKMAIELSAFYKLHKKAGGLDNKKWPKMHLTKLCFKAALANKKAAKSIGVNKHGPLESEIARKEQVKKNKVKAPIRMR